MVPCLASPCLALPCWVEPDRTPKSRSNHSQRPASPTHLDPADCSIITDIWTGPWGSSALACGHRNGPAGEGGGGLPSRRTRCIRAPAPPSLPSSAWHNTLGARLYAKHSLPRARAGQDGITGPRRKLMSGLSPAQPSPASRRLPCPFGRGDLSVSRKGLDPRPCSSLAPMSFSRAWPSSPQTLPSVRSV